MNEKHGRVRIVARGENNALPTIFNGYNDYYTLTDVIVISHLLYNKDTPTLSLSEFTWNWSIINEIQTRQKRGVVLEERLENIIENAIMQNAEAPFLWWKGEWWDGNKFLAEVGRCRESLKKSGFGKGDRLVLYLPNSPMILILSMSVWMLGGTVVPLNGKGNTETILDILRRLKPSVLVMPEERDRHLQEVMDMGEFITLPAPLAGPLPSFRTENHGDGKTDRAVIFATSGTTGRPKLVPLDHSNLLHNAKAVHENVEGFESGKRIMNILPNFHAFGFTLCGLLPMLFALPQVILPSFIPVGNTFKAMEDSGVQVLIGVPAMLPFLLGFVAKGGRIPSSLGYILTGGGSLDPQLEKRVEATMGVVSFQGYGLTECSPVVAANRNAKTKKTGTIGLPMPGYEIQIRDKDGKVLSPGEEGILWVRGPSVCSGYMDDPELNRERFRDGWFNTDDIVSVDADGYIKVLDRASDLIIVGGFNVYPQEVEEVLKKHPYIANAAVVGGESHLTGEYVKAFVVPVENKRLTAVDIIQFCKENLAHYKVPRRIEFVDSLPLSPVGKVLRRKLKQTGK